MIVRKEEQGWMGREKNQKSPCKKHGGCQKAEGGWSATGGEVITVKGNAQGKDQKIPQTGNKQNSRGGSTGGNSARDRGREPGPHRTRNYAAKK